MYRETIVPLHGLYKYFESGFFSNLFCATAHPQWWNTCRYIRIASNIGEERKMLSRIVVEGKRNLSCGVFTNTLPVAGNEENVLREHGSGECALLNLNTRDDHQRLRAAAWQGPSVKPTPICCFCLTFRRGIHVSCSVSPSFLLIELLSVRIFFPVLVLSSPLPLLNISFYISTPSVVDLIKQSITNKRENGTCALPECRAPSSLASKSRRSVYPFRVRPAADHCAFNSDLKFA